jgi:hypothetical protein
VISRAFILYTNRAFTLRGIVFWRIRDGKIVDRWATMDVWVCSNSSLPVVNPAKLKSGIRQPKNFDLKVSLSE